MPFLSCEFVLEGLVALQQHLDGLVLAPLALEVLQLALQAINVLLGHPDRPLSLSVLFPLACELFRRQSTDVCVVLKKSRVRKLIVNRIENCTTFLPPPSRGKS